MNKRKLEITLESTRVDGKCPLVSIKVNGQTDSVECTNSTTTFLSTVKLGWNRIEISLVNKTNRDTKLNADGSIAQDLYVIIKSLKINQFELVASVLPKSKYLDLNGNNIPNTNGFMGFNGKYIIDIFYPTNIFIRNINLKSV